MLTLTHPSKRCGLVDLLLAACMAATPLGCTATEAEESPELGQSSEAILSASGGVLNAVSYFPAIGESRIFSNPANDQNFGACTGTLIDDHTVLTAAHCVCSHEDPSCVAGTIQSSDPRDAFRITKLIAGMPRQYVIPVEKWWLINKDGGIDDIAIVRLKYRVPKSIAIPLSYGPWGANDTADYGTFGMGPGPMGAPNAKRVGLHTGTFNYTLDTDVTVGRGDSGGPTLADWNPYIGNLEPTIIAVNSAHGEGADEESGPVISANPFLYSEDINETGVIWNKAGLTPPLPPVSYIGSDVPASSATVGWDTYTVNGNWYGSGFSIGGSHYEKGIYAHANSDVRFPLYGHYYVFHACVGLDDGDGNCGDGADFTVEADGVTVAGPIAKSSGQSASCFTANVTGVQELVLRATPRGSIACDEAEWVDAYLIH